jgi:hypothetical protein
VTIEDRIRKITYRGYTLWQHDGRSHDWEIEPATFIRRLLRSYGHRANQAAYIMREIKPVNGNPHSPIKRLIHGDETFLEVSTWVGRRYATIPQTRKWLASNGFNVHEVRSLLVIAETLRISADEAKTVRALVAHGIRA